MLNYIIKAILSEDGSIAWQVNGNAVSVARLMAHQRAIQRIKLSPNGFIINDGETVKVSFFNAETGIEINEEPMFKMDGVQEWIVAVPALVHNTPGEWEAQFFIVDESGNVSPSQKSVFVEYSSIKSAGLEMVTEDQMQELFTQTDAAKNAAVLSAQVATEKAEEVLSASDTKVHYGSYDIPTDKGIAAMIYGDWVKLGDILIDSVTGGVAIIDGKQPDIGDGFGTFWYATCIGVLPKTEVAYYKHRIQITWDDYRYNLFFNLITSNPLPYFSQQELFNVVDNTACLYEFEGMIRVAMISYMDFDGTENGVAQVIEGKEIVHNLKFPVLVYVHDSVSKL